MDQNQYFPEGTGELGNPSSDETIRAKVHQLIERFAPAMPEMKPQRVAIILGNHIDHSINLMRLLEKSAEHSITLTDVVAGPMKTDRPSVNVGLHDALIDLLHQMQIEEACVCTESPSQLERFPKKVVFLPTAPKFDQFQANQRAKRPPAKRQFAQIRPPRRGGR